MRYFGMRAAVLAILFAAVVGGTEPANSQIKFEFGGGDQLAIAYLEGQGFTDVRILANELIQVRVEACREGIKYRFKVRIDGKIFDLRKIGTCGAITVQQARKILRDAGYRDIEISASDGRFIAFGCRNNSRFRVIMQLNGSIAHTKRVGSCLDDLSRGEIAAILRRQGFEGIEFQQSEPPNFVVQACLGRAKFRLLVDRQGNILDETRAGLCEQEIDPRDIPAILAKRGFSQVDVVDDRLPRYVAIACKDGKQVELTLNRYGKIVKTKRIGKCAKRLSRDEIVSILDGRGFKRINVITADDAGYTIDACYKGRFLRMQFTIYGDFVSERDRGQCRSRRVTEILDKLEDAGVGKLEMYVEGCRRGRRVQYPIDALGDLGKRKRIGSC